MPRNALPGRMVWTSAALWMATYYPERIWVGDGRDAPRSQRDYTWSVEAVAVDGGETMNASGTFTVADADSALPAISDFSISPQSFTPNQDGIDDRISINVFSGKSRHADSLFAGSRIQQRYYVA